MDWVNIFIFLYLCTVTSSVLISSPFDNFRIECPNKSGAQRITIKMAESEGRLRQDTVFSLSCNPISEVIYSFFTYLSLINEFYSDLSMGSNSTRCSRY